jgi:hypothetical protein
MMVTLNLSTLLNFNITANDVVSFLHHAISSRIVWELLWTIQSASNSLFLPGIGPLYILIDLMLYVAPDEWVCCCISRLICDHFSSCHFAGWFLALPLPFS